MPIRVQAPDGSIAEFPDGMKDADIESVMQREYPRSARGVPFAAPGGPSANWDAGNGKAQAATQFGGNQPDFAHNKTFSNIVSEGYGEASQLLGLNGMLDRAVYGGLGQVA